MATDFPDRPVAEVRPEPPVAAVADPAPLGLAGFAMTTVLLSAANAGLIDAASGSAIFVGMALAYGGLGQFMAGMWEFKRNNTFGATAFSSYGAFWIGTGILILATALKGDAALNKAFLGDSGFAWFLFAWGVFTTYMFVASLRVSGAVALVFLLLALTFYALWIGAGHHDPAKVGWTNAGGWLGLATAVAAFYASFAGVLNTTWGRQVLQTWPASAGTPLLKRP